MTARTKKAESHDAEAQHETENPKQDPKDTSNRIKDPKDWTTGSEPMTGAQASYLKTLAEQAKDEDAYDDTDFFNCFLADDDGDADVADVADDEPLPIRPQEKNRPRK